MLTRIKRWFRKPAAVDAEPPRGTPEWDEWFWRQVEARWA